MTPAIEIEGLSKVYGFGDDECLAVDSLELPVDQGEVFGFLGPNGAGKTTTIQMLLQIVYPTSGSAKLLDQSLGASGRERIGYLPEMFQFHDFMRADEFLDFHGRLFGMPKNERRQRIPEVLDLVGLAENSRARIRTFSKGMLQRIGIGQAIINRPLLLFLDEPTSALDPMGRRDMRDLIVNLKREGTTIFLNSHMLSEVEMICDRVGIMNQGRLARVSDIESITRAEHHVDIKAEGLDDATLDRIRAVARSVTRRDGYIYVTLEREEQINQITIIIAESGATLLELKPRQVALEDAFLEVIEETSA
ncbi:MAG: ABC transporter ATP-binding protein [Thermoleophilia bacterium]